ncbi:transporter family-2 protein [Terribacillus halophilus]|uniref:Transporter family-2 protein n=1 Tax=Terribacillus halophilus TaxID=361279 RepID=A0A1G6VNK3_9BACI|nr:DMT family transporter [Terribacillus halophilus]SDD55139.1 transporter family-2 protein [Terribacillus halophilus]
MITALIGILIGTGLSIQTAVNSQLRKFVISPYLASMISFVIGALFLTVISLVIGSPLGLSWELMVHEPIWIWLGGVLGVIFLTVNILLFPKLGSVQTAIMPILGQIIMGMLIDNFGWFHSRREAFDGYRLIGICLVLVGVFFAIAIQEVRHRQEKSSENNFNLWIWRLIGIVSGMLMSTQVAINGQLGVVLDSSIQAAFVSFFVGAITLIIVVGLKERSFVKVSNPIKQKASWWVWFGGFLGAAYVLINIYLVGQVGTGQTVVLVLFGQIAGSLLIQRFGWMGAQKTLIDWIQVVGLFLILAGVILIRMF